MPDDEQLEAAYALRRAMLGDEYVDSQQDDPNPTMRELSDFITGTAWGVWTRQGPLSIRDRSLIVMAILASLNRQEELRLHMTAAPNAGVTDAEIDELLFQLAAYAGAPAGLTAKRILLQVRAERDAG
jgi:4-carboxymuconolactone decarboxylase